MNFVFKCIFFFVLFDYRTKRTKKPTTTPNELFHFTRKAKARGHEIAHSSLLWTAHPQGFHSKRQWQ
jgi:hypothetical protein